MSYMHEAEPYGYLLIEGKQPPVSGIAALLGRPLSEVKKALSELEGQGVFSRREDGAIYSRRMVRDKAKAEQDRVNGKGGGNPKLKVEDNHHPNGSVKRGVNPPVKAHMPEARDQKEDAADAAPADQEVDLFRRGKQILGASAGGLIKQLLAAKEGKIPLARAALETAATKENPREYVGAVLRNAHAPERMVDPRL